MLMMEARNEKDLWKHVSKAMKGRWTAQRHSDTDFNPGVPDVSFVMREVKGITGWCELKVWKPKDVNYKLPHYTQHQKDWMIEQHGLDIPVSLLLDTQTEYYLFCGEMILAPGTCHPNEYIHYCSWRSASLNGVHEAFLNLVKNNG